MMKIKISLQNCYGIKSLVKEFDFSQDRAFAIYAPNGIMKTSFAKTFQDLSDSKPSQDLIFKDRETNRIIKDEYGNEIQSNQVFVMEPYNQGYKSSKISTLLVNKTLKEQYDKIYQAIDEKKEILIKELKLSSGLKSHIEETLSDAFTHDQKQFFISLKRVQSEVYEAKDESLLSNIIYQKIFNDKVLEILKSKDFIDNLSEYIKIYDDLLSKSNFFKKGVFNHNNAAEIARNLKDNGFFKANHAVSISLSDGSKNEIRTEMELESFIQQEKDNILKNPALSEAFNKIDDKIKKNKELRDFREYLLANMIVITELVNLDRFKQKLWIAYLAKNVEAYKDLLKVYDSGKEEIEKIVAKAKEESTKWREVIDIFNDRFSVPFIVKMENQDDVILKSAVPNIKFEFKDGSNENSVPIGEDDLLKVLSNGEKKALYILNIIFEVEARKETKQKTLYIVDDIADSFDYKNKYAIIEYLKDISKEEYFYQIILSHNFDFYRTICSRFYLPREHKLHTVKSDDSIKLIQEKYQKNPFTTWKNELCRNSEMMIASIPFVRNLAEYCGLNKEYDKLTSLLHIKQDTNLITIGDLELIFKAVLKDKQDLTLADHNNKVKDLIYNLADSMHMQTSEIMDLENKIVLSIAIRLKTEEFLIKAINNDAFWKNITNNQTIELINKYKVKFANEFETIKLVEQVNIMTPENIHINSFMYEPILDMSDQHLKQLYKKVSNLAA